MSVDEKRIREFAYQIWESEGRPEGQESRHWEMALKLAEAEAGTVAGEAPDKPKRGRRSASPKAESPAATEEVEKPAKKPRASKPKADATAASKPAKAPKASKTPKA